MIADAIMPKKRNLVEYCEDLSFVIGEDPFTLIAAPISDSSGFLCRNDHACGSMFR